MQPVGGLLAGIDDALPQLFQFLRDLVPVVAELFQNLLQRLREGPLQVRVVVKLDLQVVADGMFNLGRLRLRPGAALNFLLEVLVEDRNGLTFTSMPRDSRKASVIFRSFGGMPFMLRRSSRKCFPARTLISMRV